MTSSEVWISDEPVCVAVCGDSMLPTLRPGDRVEVIRGLPETFRRGDLIVFPTGGETHVHRFLEGDASGFLEMGDNRLVPCRHEWPDAVGRAVAVVRAGIRYDLDLPGPRRLSRMALRRCRWRSLRGRLAARRPRSLSMRICLKCLAFVEGVRWGSGGDRLDLSRFVSRAPPAGGPSSP